MRVRQYRESTKEELEKTLSDLNLELIKSRGMMRVAKFKEKKGGNKKGGSNLTKRIKKEIARVKTILREKEIQNETKHS